jgi:hypothetical protein
VGLTLYTATLPFSILAGSEKQAADTLVLGPADATFRRCLGCTPAQEQQRRIEARTRKANPETNQQEQARGQESASRPDEDE